MAFTFRMAGVSGAVLALAAACVPSHVVEEKALNRNMVVEVLAETAAIRNLPLKRAIPVELVERDQIREELVANINGQIPPGTLRAYEILVKKLRLLPNDFDLQAYASDMIGRRVAGQYDMTTGAMRIVRRNHGLGMAYSVAERILNTDVAGEFLLAHELAHALADQHFDLSAYADVVTNTDMLMARGAFAEGDAMLVGMYYAMGKPLRRVAFSPGDQWNGPIGDWMDLPPVFRRPLLFAYFDGLYFATEVYNRGGTRALDQAYRTPPRSTEEVLHPEKYFRRDDPPIAVRFEANPPGFESAKIIDENTLGEIGVQTLLAVKLGWCGAASAAAGWGGDRYRLFEFADGQVGFAWKTEWDSRDEQIEFADNLDLALRETFDVAPVEHGGVRRWQTESGAFTIQTDGRRGALFTLHP